MIDSYSDDRTGWARFSDDERFRYRLSRVLTPSAMPRRGREKRVVFCLLNPSTADAFKLDRTVNRCVGYTRAIGGDITEVVNIFAIRSKSPKVLYVPGAELGDDTIADDEILAACSGAWTVIAGWGGHGALRDRGTSVRNLLESMEIPLHYLTLNQDGNPGHPLYLPAALRPQRWS